MDGFWFGYFKNLSCVVPLLTYITKKCQLRYNKVPEWWPSKKSMVACKTKRVATKNNVTLTKKNCDYRTDLIQTEKLDQGDIYLPD